MVYFKKFILFASISMLVALTAGCSDDKENDSQKTEGDHVWKSQTDALKSAKEMSKKMQESLKQQQQTLEETD